MAKYQLFDKDGNITNIIEAEEDFVRTLKDDGDIGDFKDVSKMPNPVSLMRNEEGYFVPNLPRPAFILPDMPKQITAEEVMKEVDNLKEKISAMEKQANQQISDVNGAILAIKGFM
ncbi:MAG: hypothetical protein EPO08_20565, partial [Rhodospirillaceae bacterium]